MADFVINEWLWADLSGQNGKGAQAETFLAFEKLIASEHRIIIIEGSSFDQKAWRLCKSSDMIVQRMAGIFVATLRQNSDRCITIRPEDVPNLSQELSSVVKPDDHYLLQAQSCIPHSSIVTTDGPLREILVNAGISSLSREEFLVSLNG